MGSVRVCFPTATLMFLVSMNVSPSDLGLNVNRALNVRGQNYTILLLSVWSLGYTPIVLTVIELAPADPVTNWPYYSKVLVKFRTKEL